MGGLFFALNLAFPLLLALGYAVGAPQNPRIFYLLALFALCSSYLLVMDGLNGRYAVLAIFLNLYFVYFGVQDLTDLFNGVSRPGSVGFLGTAEAVILVSGLLLTIAYGAAVNIGNPADRVESARDWSTASTVVVGLLLWTAGILATYVWYFFIVPDKSLEGTRGLASFNGYAASAMILAQILQPLGILLLTYAWRSTRSPLLLGAVLMAVSVQVLLGFVIDIKGMAIGGLVLVIVTIVLLEGRIPKGWLAAAALFVYVGFPVFQAYRGVISGNVSRAEVLSNLGKTLDKVLAAETRVNTGRDRAQTFFERLSLKSSVEMIVGGTARGIPYEEGFTMTPILSAFLPRVVWTDKPDVPTGRILNKVFHVTDQEETYISPSHLGELYWNFGWAGALVGMTSIGAILGMVARLNLADRRTVTRLLMTVMTVEMLIHGFEGAIAGSYVVWMRSAAAIGVMHWIFAKVPVSASGARPHAPARVPAPPHDRTLAPFPNLLL